jgi:hypothetical protein
MYFLRTVITQPLASGPGRAFRGVLGVALVVWGYTLLPSTIAFVVIGGGFVLLAAGIFDFCVLSPLLGGPFWGPAVRAEGPPTKASTRGSR